MKHENTRQFQFANREDGLIYTSFSYTRKICMLVSSGNLEELKKMLPGKGDMQFVIGKMSNDFTRHHRYLFISSLGLLTAAAITGGLPEYEAYQLSDTTSQTLDETEDIDEMSDVFFQYVLGLTKQVHRQKQQNQTLHCRRAFNYVESHIYENINIKTIAAAMHITPGYLSTVFFENTGERLSDYIVRRKIEEAKILLKTTNKTSLEISNLLHYASQSYFICQFKKQMEMTPNQYRNIQSF